MAGTPHAVLPVLATEADHWQQVLYAFLLAKERRSGSRRTMEGYARMLEDFFTRTSKTPDEVTSRDVFAFAHGVGLSGKEPSPITIGARISCLSSFFRFLVRMGLLEKNPCDQLERPRLVQSPPRGLSAEEVQKLLAVIPPTPVGLRNRAIILFLVLTGRRRAEVFRLTRGDLTFENGRCLYSYRGKGGKTGRRELPEPALEALRAALSAYGRDLGAMAPHEPLWPSQAGGPVRSSTFYGQLQKYFEEAGLPPAGVHVFRHTAAKLRRDAGESVEDICRFLDHSSLAVTSAYLRRLESAEDPGWGRVAEAIGV